MTTHSGCLNSRQPFTIKLNAQIWLKVTQCDVNQLRSLSAQGGSNLISVHSDGCQTWWSHCHTQSCTCSPASLSCAPTNAIGSGTAVNFVLAPVTRWSTVNDGNSVLGSLPKSAIMPLQCVQHAAAQLILDLRMKENVTPALRQLHWLPVDRRVDFKLCTMMHSIHTS